MGIFTCGSHSFMKPHKRKGERSSTVRLGGNNNNRISRLQSNLSSKALLMVKMISWRKVQDDPLPDVQDDDLDGEEEVWRRSIIMGEKCRPLDFSGKILYDCDGNLLPNSPPH